MISEDIAGAPNPCNSCEITAKEAVLLGPILRAATGVACLKLCYNHLRDGGAEAVSSSIERHSSLHTMDLGAFCCCLRAIFVDAKGVLFALSSIVSCFVELHLFVRYMCVACFLFCGGGGCEP